MFRQCIKTSQFCCYHSPINKKNYSTITKEKLALMRPSAILINDACEK
ncbi:NAD(P)-dependent oxidoreductase [Gilliamella sp. BG6]